jgi:hypothetical protein
LTPDGPVQSGTPRTPRGPVGHGPVHQSTSPVFFFFFVRKKEQRKRKRPPGVRRHRPEPTPDWRTGGRAPCCGDARRTQPCHRPHHPTWGPDAPPSPHTRLATGGPGWPRPFVVSRATLVRCALVWDGPARTPDWRTGGRHNPQPTTPVIGP